MSAGPDPAPPPIRVMVVDDSVVVRRVLARALEVAPGLELAGVASNGKLALARLNQFDPDLVVLDLDMPELDGFGTLRALAERRPDLPAIVFSHLTADGAKATLDALELGARGFALKPRADGIGLAEEQIREELFPLIHAIAAPRPAAPQAPLPRTVTDAAPRPNHSAVPHAVVLATSTGGPNALAETIPSLPADLPVPVLIVQHMPPVFTRTLAERLARVSRLDVIEAQQGDAVVPGRVYVAPGGLHMKVERNLSGVTIALDDGPPVNGCRPAADVLFETAAQVYGRHLLGVVLTGMGRDGTQGCNAIRSHGGTVVAQTPESSVVPGMPASVLDAGLADSAVDLDHLATEIARRVKGER